jgi:hypothetical protein
MIESVMIQKNWPTTYANTRNIRIWRGWRTMVWEACAICSDRARHVGKSAKKRRILHSGTHSFNRMAYPMSQVALAL